MKLEFIDKNKIKPDKNQPRKSFQLDELIESIKDKGILTPLITTPDHPSQILDGERRWRAAMKIDKIKKLPCIVMPKEDYDKPDKRLEAQLIIDEMREDYNVIDRAEAYQRYIDAGHSERELARLLRHKDHKSVSRVLSLLGTRAPIQNKLKQDDTNWTFHAEVETGLNGSVPEKQKHRIHQRVIEGAFKTRDELRDTLQFAREHPVKIEKLAEAKDTLDRELIMMDTERTPKAEYKPKKKERTQEDVDKMRFTEMIQALNAINGARTLWAMTDSVELIKRLATKEQIESIIKSIETIVKVWTKTLKELKK